MDKLKIGVSSCLLGNRVRYDGNHKHDRYITDTLGNFFEWVPVCPEVECGLGIPRESMHLIGNINDPHLLTIKSKTDHTKLINNWIAVRLRTIAGENLCGFIFKTKSPSCGLTDAKIFSPDGNMLRKGSGLFARAFQKKFPLIPVIDDGRLHNQELRENFIERIFVFARWKEYLKEKSGGPGLIKFHQNHKLLIMSHSPQKLKVLGELVANCGRKITPDLQNQYIKILMESLSLAATVKKQTNVLQHIAGYFKKQLSSDQKLEILEVIETYHKGFVPLIVPLTLLKHYVRVLNEPYLKSQIYLNPHPMELMLRNHV